MAFTQVASLIYIEGSFELLTHPRNAAILSSYNIYIIGIWIYISLAIIRSVSLRLQNEGQKKLTDCTDAHGVFDTDFLTFVFWFISGFHTDLQAWTLAVAEKMKNEGKCEGKLSSLTLSLTPKSVYNPPCPVKAQSKSKENQKINQKKKSKKTNPWKDSVASVIFRERFLI